MSCYALFYSRQHEERDRQFNVGVVDRHELDKFVNANDFRAFIPSESMVIRRADARLALKELNFMLAQRPEERAKWQPFLELLQQLNRGWFDYVMFA